MGTSATLGGDGSGKVLDYATTLFGEEFGEHSVITEDVLSPAQFLKGSTLKFGKIPSANEVGRWIPGHMKLLSRSKCGSSAMV